MFWPSTLQNRLSTAGNRFCFEHPHEAGGEQAVKEMARKAADKLKRPISMVLSILLVLLIIAVVFNTVVPQLTATIAEIGRKIRNLRNRW